MILIVTDNASLAQPIADRLTAKGYVDAGGKLLEQHINMVGFRNLVQMSDVLADGKFKPLSYPALFKTALHTTHKRYETTVKTIESETDGKWFIVDSRPLWFWTAFSKMVKQCKVIALFDALAAKPFDKLPQITDNIVSAESVLRFKRGEIDMAALDKFIEAA
jgi:hypothetical protein